MAWGNLLCYCSYYYDEESGFYYLQSRYYDPTTCRFINADSVILAGFGIVGYNQFTYCINNPVRYHDVCGYMPEEDYITECPEELLFPDKDALGQPQTQESNSNPIDAGYRYYADYTFVSNTSFTGGGMYGSRYCIEVSYGGDSYNFLSDEISTGRSEPSNLQEQVAMRAARTNPQSGRVIKEALGDTRLTGFMKYARYYPTSIGGIEIHYVGNPDTNTFGDFKFKK